MRSIIDRFGRDESGATAIEYGLICALIFLVVVGSIQLFANKETAMFVKISTALSSVM